MGVLRIMTAREGDLSLAWGETKDKEATEMGENEVAAKFAELVEKGFSVFEIGEDGVGTRAKTFNPTATELIAVPAIQGG